MIKLFRKKQQTHERQQQIHLDNLGLFLIQDANGLFSEPNFQDELHELKKLVSITQSNYQTLYLGLLDKFAEFVQCLPDKLERSYDCHKGLLQHALTRTVAALKYRRGYMLPVGADTETCYKEQEVWTYAIFTAALLKDVWQVVAHFKITIYDPIGNDQYRWRPLCHFALGKERYYRFEYNDAGLSQNTLNPLIVKQLISDAGFHWLYQDDLLFHSWLNYLSGIITPQNTIAEIIQKAEASINRIPDNPISESNTVEKINNKIPAEIKPDITAKNEEEKDIVDSFIAWIKCGIINGSFAINQYESLMHQTAEGLFVVMPLALNNFLEENLKYAPLLKNNNKNNLSIFSQKIQSSNEFIPNHTGNYLHEFYLGEWKNRCVLQGVLLHNHLIVDDLESISVNKNLHREEKIY